MNQAEPHQKPSPGDALWPKAGESANLIILFTSLAAVSALLAFIPNWESVNVLLWTILVLMLGILWWLNRIDGFLLASPVGMITLGFIVYHILPVLHFLLFDTPLATFGQDILLETTFYSLLGLLAFTTGYRMKVGTRVAAALPPIRGYHYWFPRPIIVGLLTVGAIWHAGSLLLGTVAHSLPGIATGIFSRFDLVAATALILLLLHDTQDAGMPSRKRRVGALLLIPASLLYLFFVGEATNRRDYIKLLLGFTIVWTYTAGRLKWRTILAGGAVGVIIVPLVAILRTWHQWSEVLARIPNYLTIASFERLFLSVADYPSIYENFQYLVTTVPEHSDYLYGTTIIRLFTFWIPRSLWPTKPHDVQALIVQEQIPKTFTGGSSMGVTLIGELFWNFGPIAIVVGMVLLGICTRTLRCHLAQTWKSPWAIFGFALVLPWLFEFFRGALSSILIINTLAVGIPAYLVYRISRAASYSSITNTS